MLYEKLSRERIGNHDYRRFVPRPAQYGHCESGAPSVSAVPRDALLLVESGRHNNVFIVRERGAAMSFPRISRKQRIKANCGRMAKLFAKRVVVTGKKVGK